MIARLTAALLFAFLFLPDLHAAQKPRVSIAAGAHGTLVITVAHTVGGAAAHSTRVRLQIPADRLVVETSQFIAYRSYTRHASGDEARASTAPQFGFLLFGSDRVGPTVEIRLVELYDKHDHIASELNGVYRITLPPKALKA